ncbi:MAG: FkbM family methyltransferase [Chitinophagaceae bacterium]
MDIRLKIRNLLFRLLNKVENNNHVSIYENGEHKLLRTIIQAHTAGELIIFDVGANVGGFTSVAMKTFLESQIPNPIKIYAFEPLPDTFGELQANLSKLENCTLVNSGLSETTGTAEIFYDPKRNTCASLHDRYEMNTPSKINIELMRLDTYMETNQIKKIDLLKIDTEGHELSVLKGAGAYLHPESIRNIQFEYGGTYLDSRTYLRDIYNLLLPKGYKIYKLFRNNLAERDYHPAMENFQYANYVAMSK